MRFRHAFEVPASLAQVSDFHRRLEAFRALAPPLVPLTVQRAPAVLDPGARLEITFWLGLVPVRWVAEVATLEPVGEGEAGFLDRQIEGPFASWVHRHRFTARGSERTQVEDEIEASLRPHVFWGPVGLQMWLGLPVVFAWRAWRTRALLERA